ncbi:flagellar motor switch protein FliN [Acidithiobacillus sp. AMEEHan]|uniref:flagellar motor switch protein FliN n=1 Tax=Acidithiobacillus sp. AMEEHan TaxID=2994951 RepID=UPI0027E5A6A6|nr:flagellar motor switch protein FliN [Acidithiobacillus sp. AMEEHan]
MAENDKDIAGQSAADDIMADWSAALAEQEAAAPTPAEPAAAQAADTAKRTATDPAAATPVSMPSLQDAGNAEKVANLDMILDIPVTLSVELGHTKIQIRNLLQLAQGSVVELERLAGEPMDVLVNGYLIAQGEVVLVNDKFGIRLTDIISPAERAKKLR